MIGNVSVLEDFVIFSPPLEFMQKYIDKAANIKIDTIQLGTVTSWAAWFDINGN